MAMTHSYHISLLCRVQQDIEHRPCHSQTCDRDEDCNEPCMCICHKKAAEALKEIEKRLAAPGSRAILHDSSVSWHGDQLHYGKMEETW